MNLEFKVEGGDFTAAGNASSQIKKMLKQLNVDPRVVKRVVIALYEAEVNIVAHAYRGIITAEILPSGVRLKLADEGPGIPDIEAAMDQLHAAAQTLREGDGGDVFMLLSFLSLPVIPKLKLTEAGLVDVEAFKVVNVAV